MVASFIGFGLGLIAAIALWVVPKFLPESLPKKTETKEVAQNSQAVEVTASSFSLNEPLDGTIVATKTTKVAGTAKDATLIVVSTASSSAVLTPEENGEFSTDVNLIEGGNEITVTKYFKETEETKQMLVYYFTEDI